LVSQKKKKLAWRFADLEVSESHQDSENSSFAKPTLFTDSFSGCYGLLSKCGCGIALTSILVIEIGLF
jgi:hypothetical protein